MLLELCGLDVLGQQDIDGVSLVLLFKGGQIVEWLLFWYYLYYGNQGGELFLIIMEDVWKLIYYCEDQCYEFYNFDIDIGEQNDLSDIELVWVKVMQIWLYVWLKVIDVKFLILDVQYDLVKFECCFENVWIYGL